ncbi:MAG: histidine kinase [Salinivirgaceae bacterium]|nr:histidine kinase [Salinivirgaceae bacterium]
MHQRIIIIILALVIQFTAKAQDYYLRNFNAEDGSPTSLVVGITEDSLGYLWVGFANKGIYKYDGYSFDKVDNVFDNERLIELYKNNKNEIIIGAKNNAYVYKDDSIQIYKGLKGHLRSYTQADNGDEFIGTETGQFIHIKGNSIVLDYKKSNRRIGQMDTDKNGTTWFIGEDNTISSFSEGIIKNYKYGDNPSEAMWSVCVDDDNTVFASTLNTVKVFKNGEFVEWDGASKLLKPFANYIFKDSRGRLWFLHLDGITIYDKGKYQYIRENNFKGRALVTVFEDGDNGFWFGTTKGIMRLQNENCVLNPVSLKAEFMLKTIFQDSKERIWTGSVMDGLIYFDKSKVHHVKLPTNDKIEYYNFYEDNKGQIWVSTSNGVFVISGQNIKLLKRGLNIPNLPVYSIVQDENDNFYGTTPLGVFKLKNNSFDFFHYTDLYNIDDRGGSIFEVFADSKGKVWILSDFGLMKWNKNKFEKIEISNENFKYRKWGMVESPSGNYWLATEDTGLVCFNELNQTVKYYGTNQGLISSNIISITKDINGNIITGSYNGINKLELDNEGVVSNILTYNKDNGIIDDECIYKVLISDKEDNIWFGSGMGLIKFKEPNWKNVNYNIPTHVFNANDKTSEEILQLEFKNNHLQFFSTGIHFANPSSVQYSYYLVGKDKAWSEPSSERIKIYPNLKPGYYIFKVKTTVKDNLNWRGEQNVSFVIKTPLYYKWWSVLLTIIFLVFIVSALLKIWARKIKDRQIKKEEEKRKILELELRFLRSQMNPHFMFNSINSIQSLILSENIDQALNYLNDFGRLIRRVLNYSEKDSVTVKEEIEFIKEYLGLEKLRFKDKIEIHIEIDEKLDPAFDRMPPMLIQPFVENAIKHGLLPKKENGLLSIYFNSMGDHLKCIVVDNGVGRAHHEDENSNNHVSKGTYIVDNRIRILKQKALSDSDYAVSITDLYDEDKKPCGTKVEVVVPLF